MVVVIAPAVSVALGGNRERIASELEQLADEQIEARIQQAKTEYWRNIRKSLIGVGTLTTLSLGLAYYVASPNNREMLIYGSLLVGISTLGYFYPAIQLLKSIYPIHIVDVGKNILKRRQEYQ